MDEDIVAFVLSLKEEDYTTMIHGLDGIMLKAMLP
jgi:hypothetical protein